MKYLRRIGIVVLVNTAAAAIPAVISFLYRPNASWSYLLAQFRYGCVYAYIIGTLAFVVMNYVGPRGWRLPPIYRYPLYFLTFVTLAVGGTLAANLVFVAIG